ncbi:hypothetical protein BRD17_06060 [Halobacteriales archaeon SW_7_68_16]|nr:MAG: hypothetical protein BRD17_06060 [Halobacteriales archaeon SW_7_68_16]
MNRLDPVRGAGLGVASFVVGYLVTMGIVVATEESTDQLMEVVGWVYYNAQFASVEVTTAGASGGQETFNYVTGSGGSAAASAINAPSIVYHLVPIVSLVLFGLVLAPLFVVVVLSGQLGEFVALASIVAGVLPLAVVGTFLFSAGGQLFTIEPVLIESLVFVGLVYPVVFGAIGGAIAGATADDGRAPVR